MTRPPLLITGASSGIGRSLAEHFAGDYHVLAAARRYDRMTDLYGDAEHVTPYRLDLADEADIDATVDELLDEHGPVQHVVNNAGVNLSTPAREVTGEALRRSFAVNATAPMLVLGRLLPGMLERDYGRVVNVTSGAAMDCPPGTVPYSGSKAALNAMTVTAAKEHADADVKINLMSPGPCRTEMAPDGPLDPSECHPTAEYLLDLPADGPTGEFFWLGFRVPLFPDLGDLHWEEAEGTEALEAVL